MHNDRHPRGIEGYWMCNFHDIVSLRTLALCGWLLLAGLPSYPATAETDGQLADRILTAWKAGAAEVHEFKYDCTLQHVLLVDKEERDSTEGESREEMVLDGSFLYAFSSGKKAFYLERDLWNDVNRLRTAQEYKLVFDGDVQRRYSWSKDLMGEGSGSMGQVDEPDALLWTHQMVSPLWLAHDPVEFLQRTHYVPEQIEVSDREAIVDGKVCIEVSVPRARRDSPSRTLVYVDPGKGYLPIHFRRLLRGAVTYQLSLKYASHPTAGWEVSEYTFTRWENELPKEHVTVDVREAAINVPFDNDLFVFQFPEGTRVAEAWEQDNVQYYIVGKDGGKRYISEHEFHAVLLEPAAGRRTSQVFVLTGVFLLIMAVVVIVYVRYRKDLRTSYSSNAR